MLMGQIRDRIVAEEASKRASEDSKRQRDLKKFGKQVQVSKLQEREKQTLARVPASLDASQGRTVQKDSVRHPK